MQGRADDQRDLLDAESVAGHLLKPGSVFAFLAAHRVELFPEEMFADLFPSSTGRPSVPAEVMASVIVLQSLHGFSDAETTDAITFDLRWKAAIGWPVTTKAFHDTTLTVWRQRLLASDRPNRIFEVVREVVAQTGVLKGKTRRALDSTVLDDAVATQDTVTQLIAAIRRVGREVPGALAVIAAQCHAHDYSQPGKPRIAWDDAAARAELIDALVGDAHRLLGHLPDQELEARAAEAVALLALVAGQDVEPVQGSDGTDGRWQIRQGVAPDRVVSVVDPQARHAHKTTSRRQDGFKAHIAVEPETGIFTAARMTKASGTDADGQPVSEARTGLDLLDGEGAGTDVLADAAYGSGEFRAGLAERKHVDHVKPTPLRPAVEDGFTIDDFTIDPAARTATCPAGHTRDLGRSGQARFGELCTDCPLRARCTRARAGKHLKVREHDALQRAARAGAHDPAWQHEYRQHRPMVERSIAWLVAGGNRRVRYRGVTKNDAWLQHRTAALNLRRLLNLGLTRQNGTWALA